MQSYTTSRVLCPGSTIAQGRECEEAERERGGEHESDKIVLARSPST
jgi:hypothetical protein